MKKDVDRMLALMTELGRLRSFRDPLDMHTDVHLTPPQVHAVLWLGLEGPLRSSELAQRAGCSMPACTGIVDRLEKAGLVARDRSEQDRRVVEVRLTERGEQVAATLRGFLRERVESVLAALSPKDRKTLIDIVGRLVDAFSAQSVQGDAP